MCKCMCAPRRVNIIDSCLNYYFISLLPTTVTSRIHAMSIVYNYILVFMIHVAVKWFGGIRVSNTLQFYH